MKFELRTPELEQAIRDMQDGFGVQGVTVRLTIGPTATRSAQQNMRIWAINAYEGRDPFIPDETDAAQRINDELERGLTGQLLGEISSMHQAAQAVGEIMARDVVDLIEAAPLAAGHYKSKKYLEYKQTHGLHVLENTGELISSIRPQYQTRAHTAPEDTAPISATRNESDQGWWRSSGEQRRGRRGQYGSRRTVAHGNRPKRARRSR